LAATGVLFAPGQEFAPPFPLFRALIFPQSLPILTFMLWATAEAAKNKNARKKKERTTNDFIRKSDRNNGKFRSSKVQKAPAGHRV
jgi:hypothetical protein